MEPTSHTPVLRAVIEKPDGGERLLGIPTVQDRVIQQAIVQVLTPIFDPGFSPTVALATDRESLHKTLCNRLSDTLNSGIASGR